MPSSGITAYWFVFLNIIWTYVKAWCSLNNPLMLNLLNNVYFAILLWVLDLRYKFSMRLFLGSYIIPNLPVIIALTLLSSAPLFLILNEQDVANQNAEYAFYFLIAGVIWKIIQYLTFKHQCKDNISTKKLEGQSWIKINLRQIQMFKIN